MISPRALRYFVDHLSEDLNEVLTYQEILELHPGDDVWCGIAQDIHHAYYKYYAACVVKFIGDADDISVRFLEYDVSIKKYSMSDVSRHKILSAMFVVYKR